MVLGEPWSDAVPAGMGLGKAVEQQHGRPVAALAHEVAGLTDPVVIALESRQRHPRGRPYAWGRYATYTTPLSYDWQAASDSFAGAASSGKSRGPGPRVSGETNRSSSSTKTSASRARTSVPLPLT